MKPQDMKNRTGNQAGKDQQQQRPGQSNTQGQRTDKKSTYKTGPSHFQDKQQGWDAQGKKPQAWQTNDKENQGNRNPKNSNW